MAHEKEKPLAVRDFPVIPIYEPMPGAYTQVNAPTSTTPLSSLVVARYDMPINYEGILHFTLLANTSNGQSGPNPGMLVQLIACPGGDTVTPKGTDPAISPAGVVTAGQLSAQESQSPLVTLSDQLGKNLPVLSGNGSPAVVARNFYLPSARRIIAIVKIDPANAPLAYLLWGYVWGYRWPVGELSVSEQLRLLLNNSATSW